MSERWLGPLRLVVEPPAGWTLRAPEDPLLRPFCEAPAAASAPRATITLGLHARELATVAGYEELVSTPGWVLHRRGDELRWTLPDGRGSWFWRLTIGPGRRVVEVGAALRDEPKGSLLDPVSYPLDQIVAIHELVPLGGLLIHAAGFSYAGRAVLAAGVSGAGKTTLARLLRTEEPELEGLSDDRIIVASTGTLAWTAWGTPWAGEGRIATAASAELAGLIVMRHADRETLEPLDPSTALAELLPATSIPWYSPALAERALQSLGALVQQVPAWRLSFRPVPAAAALVRGLLG